MMTLMLCTCNFLIILHSIIDECIPCKYVVVGPRDPDFVTPLVKMRLKKRYRLHRLGKTDAANDVANKINEIIVSIRSKRCASVGKISTKDLWAMVRGKGKVKHKHILIDGKAVDPSHLNQFFASISTDPDYSL